MCHFFYLRDREQSIANRAVEGSPFYTHLHSPFFFFYSPLRLRLLINLLLSPWMSYAMVFFLLSLTPFFFSIFLFSSSISLLDYHDKQRLSASSRTFFSPTTIMTRTICYLRMGGGGVVG